MTKWQEVIEINPEVIKMQRDDSWFKANQDSNYRAPEHKGDGWVAVQSDTSASSILERAEFKLARSFPFLAFSETDIGEKATVSLGYVNGSDVAKYVRVNVGAHKAPAQLFLIRPDVTEHFLDTLEKNGGWTNQQVERVSLMNDKFVGQDQFMYQQEAMFFGESQHIQQVDAVARFSQKLAATQVKGTRSKTLTQVQASDLIQHIAEGYALKNVFYKFMPRKNNIMGMCGKDVTSTRFGLPTRIYVMIADTLLYQHVILHEMAHAIEMFHYGMSSHGQGFVDIYTKLLKDYANVSPKFRTEREV